MFKKISRTMDTIFFVSKDIYRWNKPLMTIMVIYTLAKAISPFIWIYVPKLLIDELLGQQRINYLFIVLGITLVIASTTYFLIEYCLGSFRMKMNDIRYRYIHQLSRTSLTMDYAFTEDTDTLDEIKTASRTVSNPYRGIGGVIRSVFNLFGSVLGMIGFVAIIARFNLVVLLILIVTVFLSYIITDKVNVYERSRRKDLSYWERKSGYSSRTMSDFQYGKDLRIYNLKNLLLNKKKVSDDKMIGVVSEIEWYKFKGFLFESLLFLFREGLIYGYLIYSVLYLELPVSNFIMYSVAVIGLATWLKELLDEFSFVSVQSEFIDDYRQFIKGKTSTEDQEKMDIPDFDNCDIEFDHVSFSYPNSDRLIFNDFSLKIEKGQKLAIVGINGAGKTTLVKLLTGLYSPTKGEIRINGINIDKYQKIEYWKLFSVVYQDVHIYPFTLKENIVFSDEHVDEEALESAIEHSGLKVKVDSLKDGVNSVMLKVIDEQGIELSGGENQKLATARALYKKGKILIMDEPTAALDPIAENELYQKFNEMINNRTAIYISHRLSSTRFCDVIAYIEEGELLEFGSHDELMAKDNSYANLFGIQASYYKEDIVYE